jgi:TonB family protein
LPATLAGSRTESRPQFPQVTGYEAYVSFQLLETGTISQVRIVKSTPGLPQMDVSVLELVRQMPDWSPGRQGDQAIPIGIGLHLKYNPSTINLITD